MLRLATVLIAASMSLTVAAVAQTSNDRDAAISAFADDLAELHSRFPAGQAMVPALSEGTLQILWEDLIERARDMKTKWKTNPYVEVTGFTVSLGSSPSIDVQFNFKD